MDSRLSQVVTRSVQAMSIKYNTMVYELQRQGKKVIVMSLGEAFFDIPLFDMKELPNPKIFHYSHSRGIPELREKLAEYFILKYDIPINYEKEILITSGSKAAIHFALMSILNPGDEVIIQEPAWVSYPEQVKLCYAKPVQVPYYHTISDYEDYITENTKAIIICNPHNPSGYVYSEYDIRHLLNLAEKYNLWILSDEAYSEFVGKTPFLSPASIDRQKKHTIVFNSISKNYGISGWRLGYVIGNEEVIFNILKINQHLITCPATILEIYVEKYFHDILKITEPQISKLIVKRREIAIFMDSIGLKYLKGDSTFYFFISISPSSLSSEEFCTKLLFEDFISVVPGLGYGKSCDKFLRVSIGSASIEENIYALGKIRELIDSTTFQGEKKRKKRKNALVIAGGKWQKPLIRFFQNKGHKVIVVDPYLYSDGVKISDEHIPLDVRNADEIYLAIKGREFEFVTSDQSDITVNTVAILSEQMNLNGNSLQVTNSFVNKVEMRKLARKHGIDSPKFSRIYSLNELDAFIKKSSLPIIIKPADSQSSRGVAKITKETLDSLENLFVESLRYSNCGYIIAEEFVEGDEYTAEGFASDYKHRTMAISKKKHFRLAIASSLEYPAQLSAEEKKKLVTFNDDFVEQAGLRFGITHAEYIINHDTGKVYLVEIACRGGGTRISSDITSWVSGQNVYEMFYENLCGRKTDVISMEILEKNAILYFFEFPEGKVKAIYGLDEARNVKGVFKLSISFKVGDILLPATEDRSRQGFLILFSESKDDLDQSLKKVIKKVKVEYE